MNLCLSNAPVYYDLIGLDATRYFLELVFCCSGSMLYESREHPHEEADFYLTGLSYVLYVYYSLYFSEMSSSIEKVSCGH